MSSTLIGIPREISTAPLTHVLRHHNRFQLVEDSRPNISKQLRDQELSAALLSPLDYAKESSDYRIVPQAAVTSREGNRSVFIRFREGIKTLQTLAVDPNFAFEIILAKILLAEQFDIEPKILPMVAPPDVMLQEADAALVVGDPAMRERFNPERTIDLVEDWIALTGLPLTHAIWCGREGDLTKEDIQHIQQSAIKGTTRLPDGQAGIDDIVLAVRPDDREALLRFLESFSYDLNGEAEEGLAEMMKYFYYHGITPDVSELNFYKTDEQKDDLLSDVSPN